jgi:hypothetical protein
MACSVLPGGYWFITLKYLGLNLILPHTSKLIPMQLLHTIYNLQLKKKPCKRVPYYLFLCIQNTYTYKNTIDF